MTIAKKLKRRKSKRVEVVKTEALDSPPVDRMMRRVQVRVCPYCGEESLATICKCGRVTLHDGKVRLVTK